MNNTRFEKTTTSCGAPLWTFSMPHIDSVAIGVLVFAGTRDEVWPQEAGIAHALEHMVFQGTERLPDSYAVGAEVELLGGFNNAMTSKEFTAYFCVVPAEHLHTGVRWVGDLVQKPTFPQHKIPIEMSNIVSEIRGYNDNPSDFCGIKFAEAVYGTHPLARSELGTEEAVSRFTRDDFRNFMERLYRPRNYAFVVVGNTTLKKALPEFEQVFTTADVRLKHARPLTELETPENSNRICTYERDIEQAQVVLGIPLGTAKNKQTSALRFFSTMISGGSSFPLFQEVRDRRGLCYSVGASVDTFSDYSLFGISLGTYPDRMHEAIDCIHSVIQDSYANEELFDRARRRTLGSLAIQFSSPMGVFMYALQDIGTYGKPRSPADIRAQIEALTPQDVYDAVHFYRLLDPSKYTSVYVVPKGTKVS